MYSDMLNASVKQNIWGDYISYSRLYKNRWFRHVPFTIGNTGECWWCVLVKFLPFFRGYMFHSYVYKISPRFHERHFTIILWSTKCCWWQLCYVTAMSCSRRMCVLFALLKLLIIMVIWPTRASAYLGWWFILFTLSQFFGGDTSTRFG